MAKTQAEYLQFLDSLRAINDFTPYHQSMAEKLDIHNWPQFKKASSSPDSTAGKRESADDVKESQPGSSAENSTRDAGWWEWQRVNGKFFRVVNPGAVVVDGGADDEDEILAELYEMCYGPMESNLTPEAAYQLCLDLLAEEEAETTDVGIVSGHHRVNNVTGERFAV